MILQELEKKKLITPPPWLTDNTQMLCIMGSIAYGVAEDYSDFDVYGYTIPTKETVFPNLAGEIPGFGTQKKKFEQYEQHHVLDPSAMNGKGREYDFNIYNIVKYFHLCMEGNPNMIDSLFVPQSCILHSTRISEMVRDNRKLFLSKKLWHRLKGYAYAQLHKSQSKSPQKGSKREKLRERHGYDSKYLYHVIRLLGQAEQIFTEGDLDLQEKGRREHMKAVRRGEVPEEEIRQWASEKEKNLEKAYAKSTLPHKPREAEIKRLLLICLEEHYGSLDDCISEPGWAENGLREIDEILQKLRKKLY